MKKSNWKTISDHFFSKEGGLNFLFRYNYDVKYPGHIPTFYKDILTASGISLLITRHNTLAKSDAKHRENWQLFALDEATQIDLQKLKARDYYRLLLVKKHQSLPTGPERWSKGFPIDREGRRGIFRVVPNLCKDSLPRRRS